MKSKIIMVTGGQRSGKSEFAERLALEASERPLYVATARVLDDEMKSRVEAHRLRRSEKWDSVDADTDVASVLPDGRVILVDCVTMWITNLFFDHEENIDTVAEIVSRQIDDISNKNSTVIFVTNEISLGGVSPDPMTRKFTDLHGKVNRLIAETAEDVYFVISGIPVKIK